MENELKKVKYERKKELLFILETKKKALQKHVRQSAKKSICLGKGLFVIGASVFLTYTIFNQILESKFKIKHKSSSKLLYPILSILLQQGASTLFNASQKKMINHFKNRKN